jgi:hypothetical protein
VTNFGSANANGGISILFGNGEGTFQPANNFAAGKKPRALAASDFNRDHKDDLVLIDSNGVDVLLGNGDGTFGPAISNYNGLVTSFQHRFSRWTQGFFQVNYTWGHALDEVSNGGVIQFTQGTS